jgi:transposase InsO family protein
MSKAQLVITAVVLEGRSKSEVARDYEVTRTWVQQLCKRYRAEGAAAFEPRSRRPRHNPQAVDAGLEEEIVRLRKTLDKQGYDAGAATIAAHLARDPSVAKVPAVSTIWRILKRRGFVTPQPHKRPRSSWKRFCAQQPNQLWQADVTHWRLADHTEVEILDIIDDHSRLAVASHARPVTTGPDVVDTFCAAFAHWGTPAGVLTDNGAIFTAKQRGNGRTALEITLGELRIKHSRSRPYHPQTCGKVERFHQTLKKHLRALPAAATIAELQHQIDAFLAYYNTIRPHRALRRRTPLETFNDRPKAFPSGYQIPPHYRVRHDKIDAGGVITIR